MSESRPACIVESERSPDYEQERIRQSRESEAKWIYLSMVEETEAEWEQRMRLYFAGHPEWTVRRYNLLWLLEQDMTQNGL